MVRLATVGTAFHARIIAARLGADGIVTELRGAVDGPYPMGDVHVYVAEGDADEATELLLVDEVESAFDVDAGSGRSARSRARELWFVATSLLTIAGTLVSRAL